MQRHALKRSSWSAPTPRRAAPQPHLLPLDQQRSREETVQHFEAGLQPGVVDRGKQLFQGEGTICSHYRGLGGTV